jgi:hypothetical protein
MQPMKRALQISCSALFIWLGGCLPAYENGLPYIGDMIGLPAPDMAGDLTSCNASGSSIYGNVYNLDDGYKGPGIVLNIEGSSCPPSGPSGPGGQVSAQIPTGLNEKPAYLYLTGAWNGAADPIPKNWAAPIGVSPVGVLDQVASQSATYHFVDSPKRSPGVLSEVAKSLVGHGDIPAGTTADQFLANYSFIVGLLLEKRPGGDVIFHSYSVQVDMLDNTSCSPMTQCCVYYARDFVIWLGAPTATFLSFGATTSPRWFIVVCPPSPTTDITLHQTAPLMTIHDDELTGQTTPTVDFPDITVPRKPGDVVSVEWFNHP